MGGYNVQILQDQLHVKLSNNAQSVARETQMSGTYT